MRKKLKPLIFFGSCSSFFFPLQAIQSAQFDRGFFHFRRSAFSAMFNSKCGSLLAKASALRINLNLDGVPIASNSHTHPSHSQTSPAFINLVSIFRCSSSKTNPVYVRRLNSLVLVCSLSSLRSASRPRLSCATSFAPTRPSKSRDTSRFSLYPHRSDV